MKKTRSLLRFFVFVLLVELSTASDVLYKYSEKSVDGELRNFVFDSDTRYLYVGANNSLYQLSDNLHVVNSLETQSVSQILLIDSTNKVLIDCVTQFQGACRKIDLQSFIPSDYFRITIVPSEKDKSVVAVIAPGVGGESSLYIGSSLDSVGANRNYMLSARNLDNFTLSKPDSFVQILKKFQDSIIMRFVGSFFYNNYVYHFVTRSDSQSAGLTYVMRICTNDQTVRSFVEIPIECKYGEISYKYARSVVQASMGKRLSDLLNSGTEAVFATFTVGSAKTGDSALCVYPMNKLEIDFQRAIQKCLRGELVKGPSYLDEDQACSAEQLGSFNCGEQKSYPIAGKTSINASSSSFISSAVAISMQVQIVNDITVGYVGTLDGRMLKLKINSKDNSAPVYGVTNLDQETRLPVKSLMFGSTETAIYALTDRTVYSLRTFDCKLAETCGKCTVDPHCGWCMPTKRCTVRSACTSSLLWLTERCPNASSITPLSLPTIEFNYKRFIIKVNFIPAAYRSIECSLSNSAGTYGQSRTGELNPGGSVNAGYTVVCKEFGSPPLIPIGATYQNLTLSLVVDKLMWVSGTVALYDCRRSTSCSNCTISVVQFPCKWCVKNHACLPIVDNCQPDQSNIPSVDQPGNCPKISPNVNNSVVVSGRTTDFSLIGTNLRSLYVSTLRCRFKIGNQVNSTPASYPSLPTEYLTPRATVTCNSVKLDYPGDQPFVSAMFDLVWGENNVEHVIDNPQQISLQVYKCRYLVSNCGKCLTMDAAYGCGWCQNQRQCSLQEECIVSGPANGWIARDGTCPDPQINSFSPPGGPLAGGTLLTIKGINLGKSHSELVILVGNKPCAALPEGYVPSESVTCRTSMAWSSELVKIFVKVNNQLDASSTNLFVYRDPKSTSMKPKRGPMSGGTRVTITGMDLHFGTKVQLSLASKPAEILKRNMTHIEFLTPTLDKVQTAVPRIKFDDSPDVGIPEMFVYSEDPMVKSINPKASLISGGSIFKAVGTHLDVVQNPQLIVYVGQLNRTTSCKVTNTTIMYCPTPDLREDMDLQETTLDFGFVMDGVKSLLKFQNVKPNYIPFTFYPMPVIKKLDKVVVYRRGDMVDLQVVQNIEVLEKFHDELVIYVGSELCKFRNIDTDNRKLVILPPEPTNQNRDAVIIIQIGNFRQEVGTISYQSAPVRPKLSLILGLVLGLLLPLLIIAAIIGYLIYRYRLRKPVPKRTLPGLISINQRSDGQGNSYVEASRDAPEMVPLQQPQQNNQSTYDDVMDPNMMKDDTYYVEALLKKIENPRIRNAAKDVYIERKRLELGNLLGKGHFGRVYAAMMRDAFMRDPIPVAVKTIEDPDLDHKIVENFLKEGIIMKNFNHPHVLSLLGLCLGYKKEPMVILPFMANGDLRSYVKDKNRNFTARQLLQLGQQVAEGMSYLSSLNFIHRDLAARNCMIDDKQQVKVADFGLSHELHDREYYSSKDHKAKLPIKWMAIESLEDFIFTTKSDVWSFGVLLWELITRGVTPYPDVEVFDTRNYLASGRRLRQPKFCSDNIYALMMDCWEAIPERRPSFTDLVNRLEVLLSPPKRQSGLSTPDGEPTYINVTDQESQGYLKPSTITGDPTA